MAARIGAGAKTRWVLAAAPLGNLPRRASEPAPATDDAVGTASDRRPGCHLLPNRTAWLHVFAAVRQFRPRNSRCPSQFGQARLLLATLLPSMSVTEQPASAAMNLPHFPFRRLGEQAGLVLLRAALVLAVVFALVHSAQG